MAVPVLIDTDMGVDDAVALCLALASDALEVRAIVGVGGCVELDQAMTNVGRILEALSPPSLPRIGRGLDPSSTHAGDRRAEFGADGLGNWNRPGAGVEAGDFRSVYRQAIESCPGELTILATGPLTNLAALLGDSPELLKNVARIHVGGGAAWARGDVTEAAEFSFYRDPQAAAAVLASGLPITVAPLDVARFVCFDSSHAAHLAASGYRTGEVAAAVLEHVIESDQPPGRGKATLPALVAAAGLIWPDLFLKTRMRLEVVTDGPERGRCKPALGGDKSKHVDLLTAVNAVDLLENMLESLCHEAFIV